MGWDFTEGATRKHVIWEITMSFDDASGKHWRCIAHKAGKDAYWSVWQAGDDETSRYILCSLIEKQKEFGYGYKNMSEETGPFYYDCPLEYLDMTPAPTGIYCNDWRDNVRKWHNEQNRIIKQNDILILKEGCRVQKVKVIEVGRSIKAVGNGKIWRIPKNLIAEVISA